MQSRSFRSYSPWRETANKVNKPIIKQLNYQTVIRAVRKTRTMGQSHYVIALDWEDPAEVSEVSELFLSVIGYRKKTVQEQSHQ